MRLVIEHAGIVFLDLRLLEPDYAEVGEGAPYTILSDTALSTDPAADDGDDWSEESRIGFR